MASSAKIASSSSSSSSSPVASLAPNQFDSASESPREKYFDMPMTILRICGMHIPIGSNRSVIIRLLSSSYTWFVYVFFIILNPISKAIALPSVNSLDDLTDSVSHLVNHAMAVIKIAVFMMKKNDLLRLIETIHSERFLHADCSAGFSPKALIRGAVKTTLLAYCIFSSFVMGLIANSILTVVFTKSEVIESSNGTEFGEISMPRNRKLPFLSWYPFSTEISPNYELAFAYQILAIFITAEIVMALDSLVVGFMVHIKVQLQILSHNLRYIKTHAKTRFPQIATISQIVSEETGDQLIERIELDLENHIDHHQAIIQLSQDLESVFTYQILLQFICSLFSFCTLLWQISSTPVLTAKFGSMFSYLGATGFQLSIYCWFGNEMMLESLSVAEAAWDSEWYEITSRRYCRGIALIIHRSQQVIQITAGGFVGLTLETFMTISRAAYSVFAVLKKTDF